MENNGTTARNVNNEQIQSSEVLNSTSSVAEDQATLEQNQQNTEKEQEVDYSSMSKEELLSYFATSIQEKSVNQLRSISEQIKTAFYKIHNLEMKIKEASSEIIDDTEDALEARFKELMNLYRTKRDQYITNIEHEKEQNYKAKLAIIDELKKLTESPEKLDSTFTVFRDLQSRWREIGNVPQAYVNDMWETYNHYIEIFYNYIKINKELRDFDLKKNLESKTRLCELAEKLVDEPSEVKAFRELQKLHDEWREIGPVNSDVKEAIWERFKESSTKINKRHQEYFEKIKEEQVENLKQKEILCTEVESINYKEFTTYKEWDEASDKILEIQKKWKTIGFAPKKENTSIYDRFRLACDNFFEAKHGYTDNIKKELEENLKAKLNICKIAEGIVANINNSIDWKKATDEILNLQKQWKEIGPTARKYSESSWSRFRTSCDKFFEEKSTYFKNAESEFEKNLEEKKKILSELTDVARENLSFDFLKSVQEKWKSIGFVPIKEKDELQKQFKNIIDSLYKQLKGSEFERKSEFFKKKIVSIKQNGKLSSEHDKLIQKMHQLESQITTLENNIGFFNLSKNAEGLINSVKDKIKTSREELKEVISKIKIIEEENNND